MTRARADDADDRPRTRPTRKDDDDDRPAKKKPKGGGGSGLLLVMLLLGGGAVAFVALVAVAWIVAAPALAENPKAAFRDIQDALAQKDWGRVWDRMDDSTQMQMEIGLSNVGRGDGSPQPKPNNGLKGRDRFVQVMTEQDAKGGGSQMLLPVKAGTVIESEMRMGTDALLSVRSADGRFDQVRMTKQGGESGG